MSATPDHCGHRVSGEWDPARDALLAGTEISVHWTAAGEGRGRWRGRGWEE